MQMTCKKNNEQPTKVLLQAGETLLSSAGLPISFSFGCTLVISGLVGIFNFSFSITICSGQTSNEFLAFENTKRYMLLANARFNIDTHFQISLNQ